jgi:cbb3-type cytochrome oxidase subunit 1
MNVSTFAAITVVLLVFYVGARYCTKLVRKEISPRIATWLIFEIGVVMSLASYLAGNDHSLIKAALNAADSLQVTVILLMLLIEQRGRKITFTRNELVSLVISCMAAVTWLVTKTGWIGFIGFQLVMSVAYLPTFESLWRWKLGPSPEPMEKWGINVVIALIGVVVDLTDRHDYLAMVYPLRALVLCLVVVVLITRWEQKSSADASPVR